MSRSGNDDLWISRGQRGQHLGPTSPSTAQTYAVNVFTSAAEAITSIATQCICMLGRTDGLIACFEVISTSRDLRHDRDSDAHNISERDLRRLLSRD